MSEVTLKTHTSLIAIIAMEKDLDNKHKKHEEILSEEASNGDNESNGSEVDISIQEFIRRKKLQNRILGEIIEKIRNDDNTNTNQ
jgi:hypothetical protein